MFGNEVAIGILIMYAAVAVAVMVGITFLVQYMRRQRARRNFDPGAQNRQ
ncbi:MULTISPECIES: hypothetical protein [Plantibacter]|nr:MULTISPECIES: hypothetical protein [Plantibacter]MBD8103950.1 hypothetical protein [Plantibacter sp. CFBP 8775]MBD8467397.1 hypothetical protein [Plantibacter sp. CFBP 8798]